MYILQPPFYLDFQDSGALPANLTFKSSSRLVLSQLPNVFPPETVPLSHLASSPSQPVGLSNIRHPTTTNGHGNPQIPDPILQSFHFHRTEPCQFPSSFTSIPSFSSSWSVSANQPLLSNTQPFTQRPKLVPIFTNKSLTCHVNVTKILAEKKQQKQEEAQCVSRAAVQISSCSPISSASSLPRVSLPFFKDRKRDHNVCTTAPVQPLFQTKPAPMTEIKRGVRRTPPLCILYSQCPYMCNIIMLQEAELKIPQTNLSFIFKQLSVS